MSETGATVAAPQPSPKQQLTELEDRLGQSVASFDDLSDQFEAIRSRMFATPPQDRVLPTESVAPESGQIARLSSHIDVLEGLVTSLEWLAGELEQL